MKYLNLFGCVNKSKKQNRLKILYDFSLYQGFIEISSSIETPIVRSLERSIAKSKNYKP